MRYAGFSYIGEKVEAEFGGDVFKKNDFFAAVGKMPPLNLEQAEKLEDMGEYKVLTWLRDTVRGMVNGVKPRGGHATLRG